jgi:hypothetical protein
MELPSSSPPATRATTPEAGFYLNIFSNSTPGLPDVTHIFKPKIPNLDKFLERVFQWKMLV